MRAAVATAFLAFALLEPGSARADSPDETAQAREFYEQGKARYEAKDYAAAAALFEKSYALHRSPALLFDIAQAHRLTGRGHCAASRRYYRSYLELEPEAENRREVGERLDEIALCADQEEHAARPTPAPLPAPAAPVPPPKPASRSTHTAAVLTTGVGAALLLSGAVLYFRARSRFNEAERSCPCPEGTFSDWQKLTTLSYGLMAAGAGGMAVGGTFWVIGVSRDNAHGSSAFVSVDGRF